MENKENKQMNRASFLQYFIAGVISIFGFRWLFTTGKNRDSASDKVAGNPQAGLRKAKGTVSRKDLSGLSA